MRVVLAVNEEVATAMTLYSRAVAVDQNCLHCTNTKPVVHLHHNSI